MAAAKSFNAIFDDIVTCIENSRSMFDLDGIEEFARVVCDALKKLKPEIEREYAYINHKTKREFMQDAGGLLDRHKCAAALMISVLEVFELGRDIEAKVNSILKTNLLKEKLAIIVGSTILSTMIKDDRSEKNAGIIAFLDKNNNEFKYPDVICDSEPYAKTWALGLHYARMKNKLFVLSLSNELFLIETYNRMLSDMEQ